MATLEQITSQAAALDRDIQAGTVREDSVSPQGRLALDLYRGRVSPQALSDAGRTALGLESGDMTLSDLVLGTQGKKGASELPAWQQKVRAVREAISPLRVAGKVQSTLAAPLKQAFRLMGQADVAAGLKTPETAERRAETYGNLTRDVAESALVPWSKVPGVAGVALRALQSGLVGGGQRAAATQDMGEGLKAGLVSAALQPVAEAALYPLRLVAMHRGAKKAGAAYDAATAAREGEIVREKAATEALNQLEKQGYRETVRQSKVLYQTEKQAARAMHEARVATQEAAQKAAAAAHSESAARQLADDLKQHVPPLADLPSNTRGLVDMVYGQGKTRVGEFFDQAMADVAERAAGQTVQIPVDAAKRLGVQIPEDPLADLTPAALKALAQAGRLPEGMGTPGLVTVDAAELATKALGAWKKHPGVYRAAVNALDEAGIGDPAARAAYKFYMGLAQYIDKTKALKGETLNPEALLSGGTQLRTIEELRRRGIGHVFSGPTQAARGGPVAQPEIPKPVFPPYVPPPGPPVPRKPVIPPEVPKPDIRTTHIPWYAKHLIGGGPGAAVAGWPGYAVGSILAHALIPSQIVTRAPISPGAANALRSLPGPLGTLIREPISSLLETPSARLAREALQHRQVEERSLDLMRQAEQFRQSQGR